MTETTTHAAKGIERVAFRMGAQEFCVDIASVREIRAWAPATTLPHSPGLVGGVINLRGAVLPIVAPGGAPRPCAYLEVGCARCLCCRPPVGEAVNGHRPSLDALFASVSKAAAEKAIGVILTRMGRDGAAGLLAMRSAGACTLGRNEASSVVYGMPKAAFECGAVERQLRLARLGHEILAAAAMPVA